MSWSRLAHSCRSLSRFLKRKAAKSICTSSRQDAHNGTPGIYTRGWKEALRELSVLPKSTTQCSQPGFEFGPLAPGTIERTNHQATLPPTVIISTWLIRFLEILINCMAYPFDLMIWI